LHNNMIETTPAEVETQLSLSILSLYGNNCKNSKTKFKSQAKIIWSSTKTQESDKGSKCKSNTGNLVIVCFLKTFNLPPNFIIIHLYDIT